MGRTSKPKVTLRCPANRYAGAGERIVEFSAVVGGELVGGLVSFYNAGDELQVALYRCDPKVRVIARAKVRVIARATEDKDAGG